MSVPPSEPAPESTPVPAGDPGAARFVPAPSDDVRVLPGVTAPRREALARLGVTTVEELLRLAPRRHEDRRHPTPIAELEVGGPVLVVGRIVSSRAFRTRRGLSLLEAEVEDESGSLTVRWFQRGYVPRPLPVGRDVALFGPVKKKGRKLELSSPAREILPEADSLEAAGVPGAGRLVPVHPLTTGLSALFVRRAVWAALPAAATVADPLPAVLLGEVGLPGLGDALQDLHFPPDERAAERARRRLAFDELLVHEILLARRRSGRKRERAERVTVSERLDARIRARLPFDLTKGQNGAVADLIRDLAQAWPMNRLLQGDVGSGKTAVAVYALLAVVARGMQGAFMAPTEVLARQHETVLREMLSGSRVRIETLLGGRPAAERRAALEAIAAGEVDLVLGTHAVISRDVHFHRLALAVVDEQHKFGVRQRHDLVAKGGETRPHVLVMTATPIPRTLALTVYGDLDLSLIEGRPPGRQPVETWVASPADGRRVLNRVKEELERGRQAFVIYPLVEESDAMGLRDAVAGRERWAKALPGRRVGLLHGRMKRAEKEASMSAFRAGEVDCLVATVVVEVGVDVPNATVLIVEHAERFGLSQLHQLRGRVGRGSEGGLCVLMDRAREGTPARLEVLAATEDGFRIAEEDLKLRGVGDVLGTRQHGQPGLRAARLPRDLPLLVRAREVTEPLLAADPELARSEHRGLAALVHSRLRVLGGEVDGA